MEVQRKSGRRPIPLGDQAIEPTWRVTEAVAQQIGFGSLDRMRFAFVDGEFVDQFEDERHVGGDGFTDRDFRHA